MSMTASPQFKAIKHVVYLKTEIITWSMENFDDKNTDRQIVKGPGGRRATSST